MTTTTWKKLSEEKPDPKAHTLCYVHFDDWAPTAWTTRQSDSLAKMEAAVEGIFWCPCPNPPPLPNPDVQAAEAATKRYLWNIDSGHEDKIIFKSGFMEGVAYARKKP